MNKDFTIPSLIAKNVARNTTYDVVIIGGAFSGSSSAILLKRQFPELKVLLLEKAVEFQRKVGESTSEVSGCFLVNVLNKGRYLANQHVAKHGLRMWFHRKTEDLADSCTEIGPRFQARLPTYQLNRIRLDEDLLKDAAQAGCVIERPALVNKLELGGIGKNKITYKNSQGEMKEVTATWVIDSSGKAALISRQQDLHRRMSDRHPVASMWSRFKNVCDLDSQQAQEALAGIAERAVSPRGAATNHLMGFGWWSWIIPLENGEFSIGVTWDERLYTPPKEGSMAERVKAHVMTHPIGRLLLENAEGVEKDNNYYKGFAYYSEKVCGEGWAIVGDAAGFMDPLYSQGLDFCSHSVYSTFDLLRNYFTGGNVASDIASKSGDFKRAYFDWFNAIYRDKYWYIGDAELMRVAFLLDISTYFIGPVRLVYSDQDTEFSKMPYDGPAGAFFAKFMSLYNRRLVVLAKKKITEGKFGDQNQNRDFLLNGSFSPDNSAMRLFGQGVKMWLKIELKLLFASSKVEISPQSKTPLP